MMQYSLKMCVLVNGDKLLAKFIGIYGNLENENLLDENGDYTIRDAIIIKEVMTQTGIGHAPLPFVPECDVDLKMNSSSLLVKPFDPPKTLMDLYTKITSNIVIPKQANIIK